MADDDNVNRGQANSGEGGSEQTEDACGGESLAELVVEARLTLDYVTRRGTAVEDSVLTSLAAPERLLTHSGWSVENEVQFRKALGKLVSQIKPVTIDSLKANTSVDGARTAYDRAILRFRSIFALSLVTLMAFQIYSSIYSRAIAQMESLIPKIEQMNKERESLEKRLSEVVENRTTPLLDFEFSWFNAKEERLRYEMEAVRNSLRGWLDFAFYIDYKRYYLSLCSPNATASVSSTQATAGHMVDEYGQNTYKWFAGWFAFYTDAVINMDLLKFQILPFLYGLLGSCVYVLRHLALQYEMDTYVEEMRGQYYIKISLGPMAGVAIAWLLPIKDSSPMAFFAPAAFPFLAGYSVDLLFTIMDNAISKLKDNAAEWPQSKKTDVSGA